MARFAHGRGSYGECGALTGTASPTVGWSRGDRRGQLPRQEGRPQMSGGSVHGREPEPLDEILDCLAYAEAVHAGDDEARGPRMRCFISASRGVLTRWWRR